MPSFLLPKFQYTAAFVVKALLKKVESYRELLRFHWRRFLRNLNAVQLFFRDAGQMDSLPEDKNRRAMKLLGTIEDSGEETFSMLFHRRYHRGFMAV